MNETKHPTPWTYEPDKRAARRFDLVEGEIHDADGLLVAEIFAGDMGLRIVRACNAHDDLLAACEKIVEADTAPPILENAIPDDEYMERREYEAARQRRIAVRCAAAAIAKAKQKPT